MTRKWRDTSNDRIKIKRLGGPGNTGLWAIFEDGVDCGDVHSLADSGEDPVTSPYAIWMHGKRLCEKPNMDEAFAYVEGLNDK